MYKIKGNNNGYEFKIKELATPDKDGNTYKWKVEGLGVMRAGLTKTESDAVIAVINWCMALRYSSNINMKIKDTETGRKGSIRGEAYRDVDGVRYLYSLRNYIKDSTVVSAHIDILTAVDDLKASLSQPTEEEKKDV